MKQSSLYWIAGTGIGVMAVIAALMASQPKPAVESHAVATAALIGGAVGGAETGRNLWCGLAFRLATADTPGENATEREIVRQYAEGAEVLVAAAKEVYLAGGYDEAGFKVHTAKRSAEIEAQINAADHSVEFSFEECSALIGL